MRIDVHGTGHHFDDQTRAYAEYRVFSTLAPLADVVEQVGISLVRAAAARETSTARDVYACSVSITLRSGRQLGVASLARHAYMAIDCAARDIATVANAHAAVADAAASSR